MRVVNTEMLNNTIKDKGVKKGWIADKMGVSRQCLYLKLQGQTPISVNEMVVLTNLLQLTDNERDIIFLSNGGIK